MRIQMKILDKEFYNEHESLLGGLFAEGLPTYATSGSAAIDLIATKDYTIYPGETVMIGTGLAIWIGSFQERNYIPSRDYGTMDVSFAGIIIPRSGRGTKEGLVLANSVGLIDEDYQGELIVAAWNRNKHFENKHLHYDGVHYNEYNTIHIKVGERFAQMYFTPIIKAQFDIVEEFSDVTERGTGGLGSTS